MPRKKRVKRVRRLKPLPKLPSRHRDMSKQSVAAVLVVAILISLLGTWFVLDSITSTSYYAPTASGGNTDANIRLAIEGVTSSDLPDTGSGSQIAIQIIGG